MELSENAVATGTAVIYHYEITLHCHLTLSTFADFSISLRSTLEPNISNPFLRGWAKILQTILLTENSRIQLKNLVMEFMFRLEVGGSGFLT
jgi:hypothetical protein